MEQVLLYIKSISYIETRLLSNVTSVHGLGVMLNFWRNFQELPLVGLAKCEVVSKIENKSKIFTTSISARLSRHFDAQDMHLAFLLTAVDGSRYLVGSIERPFPMVNTTDVFPDKSADNSGCSLTVEYYDTNGLLRVLD